MPALYMLNLRLQHLDSLCLNLYHLVEGEFLGFEDTVSLLEVGLRQDKVQICRYRHQYILKVSMTGQYPQIMYQAYISQLLIGVSFSLEPIIASTTTHYHLFMKLLAFAVLLLTLTVTLSRKLSHFEIQQSLNHYFDLSMIPKQLIGDVMRDREVMVGVFMGRLNNPDFKKMVARKGADIISRNEGYQRQLSQNFLKDIRFLNDQQKLKAIKLALRDRELVEMAASSGSKDAILRRGIEVMKQDQELREILQRNGRHHLSGEISYSHNEEV